MGNKLGGGEQGLEQGDYLGGSCDNLDDNNPDVMALDQGGSNGSGNLCQILDIC